MDPVSLSRKLMSFPSVTPDSSGAVEFLAEVLSEHGFKCEILFFGDGAVQVKNLYAQRGSGSPNLCFAGHTDVVPPGDISAWRFDPFSPQVEGGILYGRGASDMKAAICAYIAAMVQLDDAPSCMSFLITGNEEGPGNEYGTKSVLQWMRSQNLHIDYCILGEPTSKLNFGDYVAIGRRGSINFKLLCHGIQGHVAYPEHAHNPINDLLLILNKVCGIKLDSGGGYFQPSRCEITSIDVGNATQNVIPQCASAMFNIRFNDQHTEKSLCDMVDAVCASVTRNYALSHRTSGSAFISQPDERASILLSAIEEVTGLKADLGTEGGISDARFIRECCPVLELGLLSKTAHKVNENTPVADLLALTEVYRRFVERFVAC